ncbi:MAG: OmpA family protein, partial [Syntrophaceae bacterium]
SAQPTQKAKEILALLAENIKDTNNKIVVEGHTDSVPFRGEQITNWELSTSRASAARRELEANGIEPTRIARVVGYSDQELLIREDPENPRNRRISIILLKMDNGSPPQKQLESIITPEAFKKIASG